MLPQVKGVKVDAQRVGRIWSVALCAEVWRLTKGCQGLGLQVEIVERMQIYSLSKCLWRFLSMCLMPGLYHWKDTAVPCAARHGRVAGGCPVDRFLLSGGRCLRRVGRSEVPIAAVQNGGRRGSGMRLHGSCGVPLPCARWRLSGPATS